MLPEVGGAEWLVIAAVALIVIGPKDLPPLLRKLGQMVGKLRGMASEFRMSFDEMARHSELEDLRREVNAMRAERFDLGADDLTFKERPPAAAGFDSPSTAAVDAGAVDAPVSQPEEPTLFDMGAHDAGVADATAAPHPAPTSHEPGTTTH